MFPLLHSSASAHHQGKEQRHAFSFLEVHLWLSVFILDRTVYLFQVSPAWLLLLSHSPGVCFFFPLPLSHLPTPLTPFHWAVLGGNHVEGSESHYPCIYHLVLLLKCDLHRGRGPYSVIGCSISVATDSSAWHAGTMLPLLLLFLTSCSGIYT